MSARDLLPLPEPQAVFEGWAQRQLENAELNATSVEKYRPLWGAWLRWVNIHELHWSAVQSGDVMRFLNGPTPSLASRRPPLRPDRMSNFTRMRYWRLLSGVYHHANHQGWITTHPLLDVSLQERPKLESADRFAQVLPPGVWAHLCEPSHLQRLLPTQSDQDWWHIRDRAMLAVLLETGITTAELIQLRGMDVRDVPTQHPSLFPSEHPGPKRPGARADRSGQGTEPVPSVLIDVMRTSRMIERTLPMSAPMAALLHEWLQWRTRLLTQRAAQNAPLSERAAFLKQHDALGPLFIARRARAQSTTFPPMDPVSVYYATRQVLQACAQELQMELGKISQGAAILRNSLLRQWLDTVGVEETLKRAGLKDLRSLRLKVKPRQS